ncbi:MAG TPA: RNA 3'-terminal phosphate cyclase [Burkholderiales bacterium]
MIDVDGAYGEGGGQLVRTAVALSALTGKPLRLANVRASRARPGLAPQHLAALRAVASLCDAAATGLELRSTAFTFEPRARPAGGELRVDVGTAGSVTLVLQAVLPVLLAARGASRVVVTGGTDVRQAPTWDYFREVLLRLLGRMGVDVHATLVRRGYYPHGGGEVALEVQPGTPKPISFENSIASWRLAGQAHVARLPRSIAERMRASALAALPQAGIEVTTEQSAGPGGGITLWAESDAGLLGASRVAERGVPAEALGGAAGHELAADLASGATLDVHLADQSLVYLALARGDSSFVARELSSHTRTAIWLLAQFLPVRVTAQPAGGLVKLAVQHLAER